MRKIKLIALLLLMLAAIQCQNLVPTQPQPTPLAIPQHIYPPNEATDIPVPITFLWHDAAPKNAGQLQYSCYLGNAITKMELIASGLTDTSFQYQSLEYNAQYYWYIVAHNEKGDSSISEIWNFRTRFGNNRPPYVPSKPKPANGVTAIALDNCTIQWSGGDPDSFSRVSYDIYFGKTAEAGQLLVQNYHDTCYALAGLEFNTKYYWKITAKDHYGAIVNGPIWSFSTEPEVQLFSDDFESSPANGNPDPLKWTINKSGAWLYISDSISYNSGGKSVCFIDTSESGTCFIGARLPYRSVGILEFCWRVSSDSDVFGLRMYSEQPQNEHLGPQLAIRAGKLEYYDADYNWQQVCEISANTWYKIRLAFDCRQGSYKIFVNQNLKVENATWTGKAVPNLDLMYFLTFNNRECSKAFLDQIQFLAGAKR